MCVCAFVMSPVAFWPRLEVWWSLPEIPFHPSLPSMFHMCVSSVTTTSLVCSPSLSLCNPMILLVLNTPPSCFHPTPPSSSSFSHSFPLWSSFLFLLCDFLQLFLLRFSPVPLQVSLFFYLVFTLVIADCPKLSISHSENLLTILKWRKMNKNT